MLALLPLISSISLIGLVTLFAYSVAEQALRKIYGSHIYDSSFHLHDISVYCGFVGLLCTLRFVCSTFTTTQICNLVTLVTILSAGYYLTFRGILLSVFSRKFREILSKRYGYDEKVCFDGSLARHHNSSIPAFVAQHMYSQISVSNRVAIPIGFVWVLFIFASSLYLPAAMIQSFTVSSFLAITLAMTSSIVLLPETDAEKPLSSMKMIPYMPMLPACIFLGSFVSFTAFALPTGSLSLI